MSTMDTIDDSFPLFSSLKNKPRQLSSDIPIPIITPAVQNPSCSQTLLLKETNPTINPTHLTFSALGLADWALQTCKELGLKKPTPVQQHCIPRILAGEDVLGLAQTGTGKTAAFALPILHRLAEDPYGVFALVVTPTRELAYQLAEQFRALGSCLNLRCAVVVGGMDMINQSQALMQRPHVVIATPGRLKALIDQNPDMPSVFSRTKFLVLDEADRVLDVGFEEELRVVFQSLPKNRQTLLFSATMTSDLQTLLELSGNKAYVYEAYEGFQTVESLKQQYVFIPKNVKDVYLQHILSRMEDMGIRSAIIFVATCRSCHLLGLLLEELDLEVAALHSFKPQSLRLSALHQFKSGKVPVLLATDVASRGLDIPTVDLVINYDIPRISRDYVHRVGRTARAGRGGLAISLVTKVDAVRYALGFKGIDIVVVEIGWPYNGDSNEVGPSVDNVGAYNRNLINHLRSKVGTPLMPGKFVDTFIFVLYDEDLKPGPGSKRACGLFKHDLSMAYDAGLSKNSPSLTTPTTLRQVLRLR